jgi:hypothetical protein
LSLSTSDPLPRVVQCTKSALPYPVSTFTSSDDFVESALTSKAPSGVFPAKCQRKYNQHPYTEKHMSKLNDRKPCR